MKMIQTNMPPVFLLLLIPIAILFLMIAIPVLIFAWVLSGIVYLVTGRSPLELYLRDMTKRNSRFFRGASGHVPPGDVPGPASGDDTIECEVISARTIDENGQEIR